MFSLDLQIFNFIHQLVGKSRLLDLTAIFFADYFGYIFVLVFLFIIFSSKKLKEAMFNLSFVSLAILLSRGIFTEVLRFFFFRNRPFVELGFNPLINHSASEASFPSGHMTFYFALVFALYYLDYKKWSWLFIPGLVLMGLARIYAGVHWPLDIAAGIVVAFVSVFIVKSLLEQKQA